MLESSEKRNQARRWKIITTIVIVYFMVLLTESGNAALQPSVVQSESSNIDNVMVEILQRCYINEAIDTVVFVGRASPFVSSNASLLNSVAVAITGDPKNSFADAKNPSTTLHHEFPVFVVTASDDNSTERLFEKLRKTLWWNYAATYLIVDERTSHTNVSCDERARELLLTTWKMDVLSGIFLCTIRRMTNGRDKELVFLYTYNPYKETAPSPWKIVDTHVGPQGHPWTLFRQKYESARTSCSCIKFENKTMDLNGFKIVASVKPHGQRILNTLNKKIDDLAGCDSHIIKTIWNKLNASVSLTTYDRNFEFGISFENGTTLGLVTDLVNRRCDINFNVKYIMRQRDIMFTSPISTTGLWIVTKHRGWKTSLRKIMDFLKIYTITGVIVVCVITVVMTGCSMTGNTKMDFMNVPRFLIGTSIPRLPDSTIHRLLIFSTMFLILVVNAVFQGKLAALETVPAATGQINTIDDLELFDYDIYAFEFIFEFITDHRPERFHSTTENYIGLCDVLVNDNHSACIFDESEFHVIASKKHLHVSEKTTFNFYEAYATRRDWPIYERFNGLIMRLFEGGLVIYWRYPERVTLDKIKSSNDEGYRDMKFEDLQFAFVFLAIGVLIGFVIFVIEIVIY